MPIARFRRILVAAVAGAMAAGALLTTVSHAAPAGGPTRGDAQGVFQAFFSGGSAIRAHNPLAAGVPGVPVETTPDGARIYPGIDGLEYCEQGWHVVLLGLFDDPALYAGGNRELFDVLSASAIQFELDGDPLETERTAVKRLSHPDPAFVEDAFAVGFGAFLAPGDLDVGTHQLQTFIEDPVFGDFDFTIGFTVVAC